MGSEKTLEKQAMLAAMITLRKIVTSPFDRTSIILQTDAEAVTNGRLDRKYEGFTESYEKIRNTESILGLLRGCLARTLHYVPARLVMELLLKRLFIPTTSAGTALLGAIVLAVSYPFEYAHTRLAADVKDFYLGNQFPGIIDCWRESIRLDGILSIFRGLAPAIIGHLLFREVFNALADTFFEPQYTRYMHYMLLLTCNWAAYPFLTVSRRMMMTTGEPKKYKSFVHAFIKIFKTEGLEGLYRGASMKISLARERR